VTCFGQVLRKVGQLCEGDVVGIRAGFVDGDGNFDGAIEIRDQSARRCQCICIQAYGLYWDVVLLELAELVSPELSPTLGDVDPKTAMTADARGALDGKADDDRVAARWRQVDVLAWHLRRPVVVEGQQIDVVGDHGFGHHVDGGDSSELRELILAVELSKKGWWVW